MPYEVRAKTGESVFFVVVGTAKEAAKIDELLDLGRIDDVSVRDWSGKIMDLGALEAEAAEA
jgi:hypothetical protein